MLHWFTDSTKTEHRWKKRMMNTDPTLLLRGVASSSSTSQEPSCPWDQKQNASHRQRPEWYIEEDFDIRREFQLFALPL